jgi:hypothetical protein
MACFGFAKEDKAGSQTFWEVRTQVSDLQHIIKGRMAVWLAHGFYWWFLSVTTVVGKTYG